MNVRDRQAAAGYMLPLRVFPCVISTMTIQLYDTMLYDDFTLCDWLFLAFLVIALLLCAVLHFYAIRKK